jgi:hypothetical protein
VLVVIVVVVTVKAAAVVVPALLSAVYKAVSKILQTDAVYKHKPHN